jgi:hypothetical protein
MKLPHLHLPLLLSSLPLLGCGGSEASADSDDSGAEETSTEDAHDDSDGHHDNEVPIGTVTIGEHVIELAQGNGAVAAGAEGHLVVKLPFSDDGATIVRAWIGGEDRTFSMVGLGKYAPSHDDYDVRADAPDPLPEDTLWWIELEQPDGTKLVGSATPQF